MDEPTIPTPPPGAPPGLLDLPLAVLSLVLLGESALSELCRSASSPPEVPGLGPSPAPER